MQAYPCRVWTRGVSAAFGSDPLGVGVTIRPPDRVPSRGVGDVAGGGRGRFAGEGELITEGIPEISGATDIFS